MEANTLINTDLIRRNDTQWVACKQGDTARTVTVRIEADGQPWPVPAGVECAVRYRRPDGAAGIYDTLPDGTAAVSAADNALTVRLAPQMLRCPGVVEADVVMTQGQEILAIFSFTLTVEPSPLQDGQQDAEDYINLRVLNEIRERLEQLEAGQGSAVLRTGDVMTGDLVLAGAKLRLRGTADSGLELTFRVDDQDPAGRLLLERHREGDPPDGPARLGGIGTPSADSDAANKAYVDGRMAETVRSVNGQMPDGSGNVTLNDSVSDAVLYTPQSLSDEERLTARMNIQAAQAGLNYVDVTGDYAVQTEYWDWESYLRSLPDGAWFIGGVESSVELRSVTVNHGNSRYYLIRRYNDSGTFEWKVMLNREVLYRFDSTQPIPEELRDTLHYSRQPLPEADQQVARENIGAAPARLNYVDVSAGYTVQGGDPKEYLLGLPDGAYFLVTASVAMDIRTVSVLDMKYQVLREYSGGRYRRTVYMGGTVAYRFDSDSAAADWEEPDETSSAHIRNRPFWLEDHTVFEYEDPDRSIPPVRPEEWYMVSDAVLTVGDLTDTAYTLETDSGTSTGVLTEQMLAEGLHNENGQYVMLFDAIAFVSEAGPTTPAGVYRKNDGLRLRLRLRREGMRVAPAYRPYFATREDLQAAVRPLLEQPKIVPISLRDYEDDNWTAPEGAIVVVLEELE